MSLARRLFPKKVDQRLVRRAAEKVASKIRSVSNPDRVILFGSAADGSFNEGSDLDLLLVYPDVPTLRIARRLIRAQGRLSVDDIPVDLIFVSRDHFESRCHLGGVCFVAEHEGIEL